MPTRTTVPWHFPHVLLAKDKKMTFNPGWLRLWRNRHDHSWWRLNWYIFRGNSILSSEILMYICMCVCVCVYIYVYVAIDPVSTLLGIYPVETICTSTKIYVQTYSFHSCLKEKQETKEQPTHPSGLLLLFSHLVVSDSLWPRGLQHARLPCPSLSTRVWSNSCPLSRWCNSTISSCASLFSFGLQSFPASGSFPMSQWISLADSSESALCIR